jgi:hypothetical protein
LSIVIASRELPDRRRGDWIVQCRNKFPEHPGQHPWQPEPAKAIAPPAKRAEKKRSNCPTVLFDCPAQQFYQSNSEIAEDPKQRVRLTCLLVFVNRLVKLEHL